MNAPAKEKEQKTIGDALEAPAAAEPEPTPVPAEPTAEQPSQALERAPASGLSPAKAAVLVGQFGAELRDLDSLYRFATMVSQSGFAPKGMERPQSIAVAIQLGLELGLAPMAALQNIAVINGRPGIFGDAALALVLASGLCEYHRETYEGEGETRKAICTTKRKDSPDPLTSSFSVADAKRAKLWGKSGPWTDYPDRMLRFRARGFNLRDNFADVLKGFRTVEEVRDLGDLEELPESEPIQMPRRASETTETTAVATA